MTADNRPTGLERLLRTLGYWPTITFAWVLNTIALAWVLKILLRLLRSQQLLQEMNPGSEEPMSCCCTTGAHKHTGFEFSGFGACPNCLAHSNTLLPIRISAKISNSGTICIGCDAHEEVGPHLQPRYRMMVLVWMPIGEGLTEQLQPATMESNPLMGEANTPPVEIHGIGGVQGPGAEHLIRTISWN